MIVERCKVNGCHVEHPSDGSIQLFEYETVMRCKQCGASTTRGKGDIEIEERTHVCDVCNEPLDVFEEAVRFTVAGSASQGMDRAEIEVHPRCAVNAGGALMAKYTKQKEPEIERGARKPKWWDDLRRMLGLSTEPVKERT